MTHEKRSERTARLLALRLEELARAVEGSGAPPDVVARLLELASVATVHAVSLDLLTSERAESIGTDARDRHPALRELRPAWPRVEIRAA